MITRRSRHVQNDASRPAARPLWDEGTPTVRPNLSVGRTDFDEAANALFRMRAPDAFVSRIDASNPDDPLLRQILPIAAETRPVAGFSDDPVGDLAAAVVPGLIHKYHGRALLLATSACAIHCRYCFRRNYPYGDQRPDLERIYDYLITRPEIHELILSGGDPLTLSNARLGALFELAASIPHLRTLRIHSRVPVVQPQRVDDGLQHLFDDNRQHTVLVLHVNHPNELDDNASTACRALRLSCNALLNQSVLLHGVNDRAETLIDLSHRLFDAGILPYYLHLLDRARGVAHFEVSRARASAIHREMRARLPGYLLPRLVNEIAGEAGKSAICE